MVVSLVGPGCAGGLVSSRDQVIIVSGYNSYGGL